MVVERSPASSGKWIVLVIAVLGLTLASVAWWYQASHTRFVLEHWGVPTVEAIQRAPHVTVEFIEPSAEGELTIGGRRYSATRRVVLDGRRGLVHFRHALVDEATFRPVQPPSSAPRWKYRIRFHDSDRTRPSATILFAPEDRMLAAGDASKAVVIGEIADRLRDYLEEAATDHSP